MQPQPSKMCRFESIKDDVWHLKTHGGLGDVLWLYKKCCNLDLPLYISVSQENRTRPRRVGRLLDHLPKVVGWRYLDESFAPGGQDWTDPSHPCCAIGKRWSELGFKPNSIIPYPLECNRWMEAGNRIEEWLPDVPITHRIPFLPPGSPTKPIRLPEIILHIAGWPDVHDRTWINAVRLFAGLAHVYIVGGSYDRRPRTVLNSVKNPDQVTLLEDAPWEDLIGVLSNCEYCLGHASGFTAIADAMGLKGAVFNPQSVPGLIGTWNDRSNHNLIHVDKIADFEAAIYAAYATLSLRPSATWPPNSPRGGHLSAENSSTRSPGASAVYAAATAAEPREALVIFDGPSTDPDTISSIVASAYDNSTNLVSITVIGKATEEDIARTYVELARSTQPPIIDLPTSFQMIERRQVAYDLIVVVADSNTPLPDVARWAWARVSRRGTVLFNVPDAIRSLSPIFSGIGVKPVEVSDATNWVYVHRRK